MCKKKWLQENRLRGTCDKCGFLCIGDGENSGGTGARLTSLWRNSSENDSFFFYLSPFSLALVSFLFALVILCSRVIGDAFPREMMTKRKKERDTDAIGASSADVTDRFDSYSWLWMRVLSLSLSLLALSHRVCRLSSFSLTLYQPFSFS